MEIMFDDLTEDAQKRLLKEANASTPEEMDWDTLPVAEVRFDEEEDDEEDEEDEEDFEEAEPVEEADDDDDFDFDDDSDY